MQRGSARKAEVRANGLLARRLESSCYEAALRVLLIVR
jgi:hypothetical protein